MTGFAQCDVLFHASVHFTWIVVKGKFSKQCDRIDRNLYRAVGENDY